MINILVLDDEVIITKGLISKIKRINNSQIGDIYESNNSLEALEIVRDKLPNIVICDMKMPDMSGLEFISAANKISHESKFIILSGYDDYQFVRKSFQQGAIDYLLKPISLDELSLKLDEAIKLFEGNTETITMFDIELEQCIHKLIHSSEDSNNAKTLSYVQSILPFQYFQMASLSLFHDYQLTNLNNFTKEIIALFQQDIQVINFFDNYKNSTIIFNYDSIDNQLHIAQKLTLFLHSLKNNQAPIAKIALTEPVDGIHEFSRMYDSLIRILVGKIMYPSYSLMIHEAIDISLTPIEKDTLNNISKWFLSKDFTSINKFIEQYFVLKPINVNSLYTVEKMYLIMLQKINALFNDHDLIQTSLFSKPFLEFDSLTSLRLYLKSCIFKVQSQITQKDNNVHKLIDSAIIYINTQIDKDIDMAQVSNHLSLNYSYFSKLFKETKGISFKKYLIQTRMEIAQDLLQDPTIKVYEIAKRVGYDNPQNFSRAFKSHFGYSPKDYRQD